MPQGKLKSLPASTPQAGAKPKKRLTAQHIIEILGVLGAIATLITAIISNKSGSGDQSLSNSWDNHSTNQDDHSINNNYINQGGARPVNGGGAGVKENSASFTAKSSPANLSLGLRVAGDAGGTSLQQQLSDLFKNLGYKTGEPAAGTEGNFENNVRATLRLEAPKEMRGAFNTLIVDYDVELTLQFFKGAALTPCDQRTYTETVSDKAAARDEIIKQGITQLMATLKKEGSFPFCLPKK